MRSSGPAVSILMPVRNGQATLGAALNDLVAAMAPNDELLVVDDGSEDATPDILQRWSEGEARLRTIRTRGVGLVEALSIGLNEAAHRWIARADADDRYPRNRLDCQRQAAGDGVVLVTGDYRFVARGRIVSELPCALTHPFVAASLVHPQRVPHPGVLFDRDAVQSVGGYRQDDFPAEDLALWLRLASAGRFVGVPEVTVDWTIGAGSITQSKQEAQRRTTAALLARTPPADLLRGIDLASLQAELAAYEGTRLASARRILLARDLRALSGSGSAEAAYRTALRKAAKHPLGTAAAALGLAVQKHRRDAARRSMGQPTP